MTKLPPNLNNDQNNLETYKVISTLKFVERERERERACCFRILSNHNVTQLKLEIDKIIKIEKLLIPLKILTNSHSYQNVNRIMNRIVNQFFIFLYYVS